MFSRLEAIRVFEFSSLASSACDVKAISSDFSVLSLS